MHFLKINACYTYLVLLYKTRAFSHRTATSVLCSRTALLAPRATSVRFSAEERRATPRPRRRSTWSARAPPRCALDRDCRACNVISILCKMNDSSGGDAAHTPVQPPFYSCARGQAVHTCCSQRPTRSERCCSYIARPEKIIFLTPSKWTGGLTGTKKMKGFPETK